MASVQFVDNTIEVIGAIKDAALMFLEESAGELESQAMRNTRVDTGQTKGAWSHKVEESALQAIVGNPLENAIWEEFGTGEYAVNGNGRKTPWRYQDVRGNWHTTTGKRPSRAFEKTRTEAEPKIVQAAKETFGSL